MYFVVIYSFVFMNFYSYFNYLWFFEIPTLTLYVIILLIYLYIILILRVVFSFFKVYFVPNVLFFCCISVMQNWYVNLFSVHNLFSIFILFIYYYYYLFFIFSIAVFQCCKMNMQIYSVSTILNWIELELN